MPVAGIGALGAGADAGALGAGAVAGEWSTGRRWLEAWSWTSAERIEE
jgi:hypothetical protein